jgi:hypothetical protein
MRQWTASDAGVTLGIRVQQQWGREQTSACLHHGQWAFKLRTKLIGIFPLALVIVDYGIGQNAFVFVDASDKLILFIFLLFLFLYAANDFTTSSALY